MSRGVDSGMAMTEMEREKEDNIVSVEEETVAGAPKVVDSSHKLA